MKTKETVIKEFTNYIITNNDNKHDNFNESIDNIKNNFSRKEIIIINEAIEEIIKEVTLKKRQLIIKDEIKYLFLLIPTEEVIELTIPSVTEPLIIESEPVVPFEEESVLEEPETIKEESPEVVPNIVSDDNTVVPDNTVVLYNDVVVELFSDWDCELLGEFSLSKYCDLHKKDKGNYYRKLTKIYSPNYIKIFIAEKNIKFWKNNL